MLSDLRSLGFITSNMSTADVFFIPNQLPEKSDSRVDAMLTHIRALNPFFTWSNHFFLSPCDHGPKDCMFTRRHYPDSKTHPSSPKRRLRMLMVTGSRSHADFAQSSTFAYRYISWTSTMSKSGMRADKRYRATRYFSGRAVSAATESVTTWFVPMEKLQTLSSSTR